VYKRRRLQEKKQSMNLFLGKEIPGQEKKTPGQEKSSANNNIDEEEICTFHLPKRLNSKLQAGSSWS